MPTRWSFDEEQLFDSSFWEDPADWPQDRPKYVFLARALDEIGRAVHGEQWTQCVKGPAEPEDPPDDCDDDNDVWEACERADEQYERAREQAKADLQNMRESLARMMAEQCELGNLVAAARPKHGGEMTELGQHHWNIDDLRRRFFRCEMSLDRPFANHRISRNDCWIYVTRASLNQYLAGLNTIGAAQPRDAQIIEQPDDSVAPQPFAAGRSHRLLAAKEAIIAIWGPPGPPPGLMADHRNRKVNAWLTKYEKNAVSAATIRRALKELRSNRANTERN